jgi:hypothetical protein
MLNNKTRIRLLTNVMEYEEKLRELLQKQIERTGRFDQKPISPENPLPQGYSAFEALSIAASMVSAIQENPSRVREILPDTPDSDKPWGMGRQWCEYENACLVNEMSLLARQGGFHGKPKCSLFEYVSNQLNIKYGIDRSGNSVKNQWYRELRARSGIDERNDFGTSFRSDRRHSTNLRTSIQRNTGKGRILRRSKKT